MLKSLTTLAQIFHLIPSVLSQDQILGKFNDVMNVIEQSTEPMLRLDPDIGKDTTVYKNLLVSLKAAGCPVSGYQQNPTKFIHETFVKLISQQSEYIKLYKEEFSYKTNKNALTTYQIELNALLVAIDEASKYARAYVYVIARLSLGIPLKSKEEWMIALVSTQAMRDGFSATMAALANGPEKIATILNVLKQQVYTPENEKVLDMMSANRVDPLKMNMVPIITSSAVWLGKLYNEFIKYRLDMANSEKLRLDIVIATLNESKTDDLSEEELAKIEKQLSVYTDRVNTLRTRIDDILERSEPDA